MGNVKYKMVHFNAWNALVLIIFKEIFAFRKMNIVKYMRIMEYANNASLDILLTILNNFCFLNNVLSVKLQIAKYVISLD